MEVDDLKHGGRRTAVVNSYFASRPEQIIGRMAYSGGMFEDSLNCVSDASQTDLGEEIACVWMRCLPCSSAPYPLPKSVKPNPVSIMTSWLPTTSSP